MTTAIIFAGTLGVAAGSAVWAAAALLATGDGVRVRQRLQLAADPRDTAPQVHRVNGLLAQLFSLIAKPFIGENSREKRQLREQLVAAGIYSSAAIQFVIGARIALLFIGLSAGWIVSLLGLDPLACIPAGGAIGYILPRLWLRRCIRENLTSVERGLPDGLDLMVVCVEAGLTVDAALQRVGEELALAHPALSRELSICHMETRIGLPRSDALRNLGRRSGSPALQAVTAMLVQADRLGTSIGGALRVQAEAMRTTRQHRAEEAAAKASVKLSFPLVLFILPATFIVLAGPPILKLVAGGLFN